MVRHLARLADETFDAVVVGGGIYGLSAAHALVQRGLSVALIERRDFGGATSFNSLKTVHGGIRSLQHGSIADAREFVRERRAIATLVPHLVRVLPFVVPTARHPVRNRPAMDLFLRAYDVVARDRNDGLDPAVHLPGSYTVGRGEALTLNPLVDPAAVTGGAVWHDYQLHSPERYALALARSVADAGGALANYVSATSLIREAGRVTGVRAADAITGDGFDVRGRVVVNAAGPWAWHLLSASGLTHPADAGFSLAMNLVLDRPPLPRALGGIAGGRFLFVVPWRDRMILGTSHEGFHQDPATSPTPRDVNALLADGAIAFPALDLARPGTVRLVHRGLLPARAQGAAHGALLKQSVVQDHRADGIPGLVSVVGVRYTTARASGEKAADIVCDVLGRRTGAPAPAPLGAARFNGLAAYLRAHPAEKRFITRYGTFHTELPAGREPLAAGSEVTRAEVLYAVRQEMALTLADVALRRTDLASGGHPGSQALQTAADTMAAECGWTADRLAREIAATESEIALPAEPGQL